MNFFNLFILLSFVFYCNCEKAVNEIVLNSISCSGGGNVIITNGKCECCSQTSPIYCVDCNVCSNIVFVNTICQCYENGVYSDCSPTTTLKTSIPTKATNPTISTTTKTSAISTITKTSAISTINKTSTISTLSPITSIPKTSTNALTLTRYSVDTLLKSCSVILCNDYCTKLSSYFLYSCGASCNSVQLTNGQKCADYQVNCNINGLVNKYADRLCDPTVGNHSVSFLKIKLAVATVWPMAILFALGQF